MKSDIPPHLKSKFRRERRKKILWTLVALLCVLIALSALARKRYNRALPWHLAWMSHFSAAGWRLGMNSAADGLETYEDFVERFGKPHEVEFDPGMGRTLLLYGRPGDSSDDQEGIFFSIDGPPPPEALE